MLLNYTQVRNAKLIKINLVKIVLLNTIFCINQFPFFSLNNIYSDKVGTGPVSQIYTLVGSIFDFESNKYTA